MRRRSLSLIIVIAVAGLMMSLGTGIAGPQDVQKALETKTKLLKYMYWEKPNEPAAFYRDGGDNVDVGVILLHGRAAHPRWMVVEPLSEGIWRELSYHTVSLQGPRAAKNWRRYADDFPEVNNRIKAAIEFLQKERGVKTVYLMGHSMGTRMTTFFLAENPDVEIAGYIGVGMRNGKGSLGDYGGGYPLDCKINLQKVGDRVPVLDIWGGDSVKDTESGKYREDLISKTYKQVIIPGADHRFYGKEAEFVSAVVEWITALGVDYQDKPGVPGYGSPAVPKGQPKQY